MKTLLLLFAVIMCIFQSDCNKREVTSMGHFHTFIAIVPGNKCVMLRGLFIQATHDYLIIDIC